MVGLLVYTVISSVVVLYNFVLYIPSAIVEKELVECLLTIRCPRYRGPCTPDK